jgi:tRNA (guanine37-N1)-methyltransferase
MRYTVLSLFPEIVDAYFGASLAAKAVDRGLVSYRGINIRDYALDKHHSCDDAPYGGGAGMLMLAEPLARCLEAAGVRKKTLRDAEEGASRRVVYLSPSGRLFTQAIAEEYAALDELVLVCGRYEGIDQRVIDGWIDEELSIGDYVLSGGESAALAVIDATYRLVEKVIKPRSLVEESFNAFLLEYPQWTRPEMFEGEAVPEVLLSGHHANIRKWQLRQSVQKTLTVRPELIENGKERGAFNKEVLKIIAEVEENERNSGGSGCPDEGKR